jgi:hypothetical protein
LRIANLRSGFTRRDTLAQRTGAVDAASRSANATQWPEVTRGALPTPAKKMRHRASIFYYS